MKVKKLIVALLIFTIAVAEFSWVSFGDVSYAANAEIPTTVATQYYGKQLEKDQEAKMFYDVMVEMYTSGKFARGEDYELTETENPKIEQGQLQAYATGSQYLLRMMAAARDAFQYDYPDAFWIDFSAITLRVTMDTNGRYHAYLGSGRRDDYLLPGFSVQEQAGKITIAKAISDYEAKMNTVVETVKANAQKEQNCQSENERLAKAAHDYVTKNMIYRYEYQVDNYESTSKPYSNARTAYDCIMYGEGVCESYTRGYKAILDRLGIPCVCVIGVYKVTSTQTEEHIWNYVQIEDKWYGVDVTMDDPSVKTGLKTSGQETRQYLLVGQTDLNAHHIPSAVFSSAEYEFSYPVLETATVAGEEYYDAGKFKVRAFGKDYVEADADSSWTGSDSMMTTNVWVSYDNMNYTQNAEKGIYILARYAVYDSGLTPPHFNSYADLEKWQQEVEAKAPKHWEYTNWGYITPKYYQMPFEKDDNGELKYDEKLGNYLEFPMPNAELIQFAVTNIPPDDTQEGIIYRNGLYYQGDASLLTEKTPEIINKYETAQKIPYIKKATPTQSSKLKFGEQYHIKIEYDTKLYQVEGEEMSIEIADARDPFNNVRPSVKESSKIINPQYDLENSTIEFDFIPSDLFAGNEIAYEIEWKGVAGEPKLADDGTTIPGRRPLKAVYAVGAPCDACAYHSQGIDWNTFGQPELMDGSSLDPQKFQGYEMGSNTLENFTDDVDLSKLSHRLSLVTTTTSPEENKNMLDKISEETEDEVLNSQTYNIRLQLCKMQVVKPGQSVRVRLGFPEGTTYEDYLSGEKEFKVYHYNYDAYGNITGVETIPVEVTRQGLILIVSSFSPFTVATVEGPGREAAPTKKDLVLSSSEGGKVTYNGVETEAINMTEQNSVEIKITAEEGKVIESISLGTKVIPVDTQNNTSMKVTVNADELDVGTTRMYVEFMSKAVEEKDKENGQTEVEQQKLGCSFVENVQNEDGTKTNYVEKIDTNMTIEQFAQKIDTAYSDVEVLSATGDKIEDTNQGLATGMILKISHKGVDLDSAHDDYTIEYVVVVHGDIDGTGKIGVDDISLWRENKIEPTLSGAYLRACDYDSNGSVSIDDLSAIREALLNR